MLLSQNRHWRVTRGKLASEIVVRLEQEELPEAWREFKDFRLEIPIDRWNRVVKHVRTDRHGRLVGQLQRVVQDATSTLVETGGLALTVVDVGAE